MVANGPIELGTVVPLVSLAVPYGWRMVFLVNALAWTAMLARPVRRGRAGCGSSQAQPYARAPVRDGRPGLARPSRPGGDGRRRDRLRVHRRVAAAGIGAV